jgi:hypothetical protein
VTTISFWEYSERHERIGPIIYDNASIMLYCFSLVLVGWTSNPKFSIWIPIFAAGAIGLGFNVIFYQCIDVLVDTYDLYAASAV